MRYTLDTLGDRTQSLVLDGSGNTTGQRSATFDALGRLLHDIGGVGQTTTVASPETVRGAKPAGHRLPEHPVLWRKVL
jgi:hypothetical protein